MNAISPAAVAVIVLASIVAIPLFWCLVVLLLSHVSGWQRLSRGYESKVPPHGKAFLGQSGSVGPVSYRNCLTVHVAPEGLFLSVPFFFRIGHKALLIPWSAIHTEETVKFLWHRAVRFEVGRPSSAQIRLPPQILEARGAWA